MTAALNPDFLTPVPERRDGDAPPQQDFVNLLFAAVAPVQMQPDPIRAESEVGDGASQVADTAPPTTLPGIGGGPLARTGADTLPLPPEFRDASPTPFPTEPGKGNDETKPRLGPMLPGPGAPVSSIRGEGPAVDAGNETDVAVKERDAFVPPTTAPVDVPEKPIFVLADRARANITPKIVPEKNRVKPGDAMAETTPITRESMVPVAAVSKPAAEGSLAPQAPLTIVTERSESVEPVRGENGERASLDQGVDGVSTNIVDTILGKFSDAFDTTVEDATAHAKADLQPEKLIDQIVPGMVEIAVPEGGDRRLLKMRLHPAELGSVEIELEKDAGGTLTARIHTESAAARHILVEGLDQLRDSLQNSGWTVGDLQVGIGSGSTNSGESGEREFRQSSVDHRFSGESSADFTITQDAAPHADGLVSLRA